MSRILLRRLRINDLAVVMEMFQDDVTVQFIGPRYRGLCSDEAYECFVTELEKPSRFTVAMKNNDEFIGFCGIKLFDGVPDFSIVLRRKFWGRGYAVEACRAAATELQETPEADLVDIFIVKTNKASLALAIKLGWSQLDETMRDGVIGYSCHRPRGTNTR